jgi:recombinational DNA repair protein (RecF pathway)
MLSVDVMRGRDMKISGLLHMVSNFFSLPRTKCSKCRRPYNDFVIDFAEGTIKCVGCNSSTDIEKELGRDQALFVLDTVLRKDPDPNTRAQAEQLKTRIKAT